MEKQTGKDRRMTGNKKRIVCGALLCVMALGMTACGNEIPDLTEAAVSYTHLTLPTT